MPDPKLETVSATETAMLLNVSPYGTRFMLFERFAKGIKIDRTGDARMNWGTKMQPLIIEQAAEDLALEIVPNLEVYHRRGILGATRDATIVTPDRGPGAFDAKCVFDYGTYMRTWEGGKAPPKHIELQLQQQMYVGDGSIPYAFGYLAVWVCGEMQYFEREPMKDLWLEIEREAAAFLADVKAGRAPDPFGDPIEAPFLAQLDRPKGSVIDLSQGENAVELAEKVRAYSYSKSQANSANKNAAMMKAQILAAIGPNERALFYGGITADVKISHKKAESKPRGPSTSLTLKPFIPGELPDELLESAAAGDVGA